MAVLSKTEINGSLYIGDSGTSYTLKINGKNVAKVFIGSSSTKTNNTTAISRIYFYYDQDREFNITTSTTY